MNFLTLDELDRYSRDIASDNKKSRQQARSKLIQHTNSFRNIVAVPKDQQKDYPNWHQVSTQMQKMITDKDFPYRIDESKAGEILGAFDLNNPPFLPIDLADAMKPGYIATMAHHPKLALDKPLEHLAQQITMLRDESFGTTAEASRIEANKRLRLFVGINYCHSLNTHTNKKYKKYIQDSQTLANSHVKIVAFNWNPVWVKEGGKTVKQAKVKRLYRLLADSNPSAAEAIYKKLMANAGEIIPYQRIRNEIKNNPIVSTGYTVLTRGQTNRPAFLVILDDDAVRYRTEQMGLLSHYDQLIEDHPNLEVASTGYYMTNPSQAFVEFASRADLVGRLAIAHLLPNGTYLPEPNLVIRVNNLENLRNRISFLRTGADRGKGLEFLGLMENLGLNKGDVRGRVVMGRKGPILTSQPPRVSIPSHMPSALTPARINNKHNLASLRMFCQSVLNPKKGFAPSVARAMPTGIGSQKKTAKISKLYTAVDPIDYIKAIPDWKEVYTHVVKSIVEIYKAKFKDSSLNPNYDLRAKNIVAETHGDKTKIKGIATLLEEKFTDVWAAREDLISIQPKITEDQFVMLFKTAINTNRAVYTLLRSYIDQVPFVLPVLLD